MSFLTDLFEGNFGNLGTDITNAPSSLAAHPDQLAETIGAGALVAAPFVLPGLLGGEAAFAGGDALAAGGGAAGLTDTAALSTAGTDLAGLGTEAGLGGTDFAAGLGASELSVPTAVEMAAAAPGTDLGTIASVAESAPGMGFTTPVSASLPGGVAVSPTGALDIGSQDVLANASGDLLDQAGAGSVGASDFPGGLESSGIPSQATSLPGTTGLDVGGQAAAPELPPAQTISNVPQPGSAAVAPEEQIPAATAQTPAPGGAAASPSAPAAPTSNAPAVNAPAVAAKDSSFFGNAFSKPGWGWNAAALGLGAAPLALALGQGESPLPAQANQLQALANTTQGAAGPALQSVATNTPTVTQAAQLAQQQNQLTTQWKQALMNQGVQNPTADTRWPQIQAYIGQQMNIATQQMINTNIQTAMGFTGQTSQSLTSLMNAQIAQDTAYTNAISNASRGLASVATLGAMTQSKAA